MYIYIYIYIYIYVVWYSMRYEDCVCRVCRASSRRLTSQLERIRKELHNEEKLEALIKLNVETAE